MSIIHRFTDSVKSVLGVVPKQGGFGGFTPDADYILNDYIAKSSKHIVPSFYDTDDVAVKDPERPERVDVTDTEADRRAIHTISNYYNTLGTYRDDFDKNANDKLSRNMYYAICEKSIQDYLGSAEVRVLDRDGEVVESASDFIQHPNPQDDFGTLLKMGVRDMVRYDAGVWVKSFNANDHLVEMKAYLGTEFWKEQDRVSMIVNMPFSSAVNFDRSPSSYQTHWQPAYTGWWSHGYTQRYWQRSRTGVYIPFKPEEVCYFMMYPRSDGIYGTDFIKYLRYQLQYLIDSTKAAGKTFENGLVPSVVWMHDNVKNIQQLEQRIREVRASNIGPNRWGSILHTVSGEKVETLAQTLHNMEWLEGQKFIAQLIWAMWGFSPTEFVGEGENRATAYVKRNVTKSRLLYPIMDHIEKKVNREVLPYLKGYKKGWRFEFQKDFDLDDDQKLSQTLSTKAATVAQWIGLGYKASQAMKLAGMGEELRTLDIEEIDQQVFEFQLQAAGGVNGDVNEEDMGRYDSENAGTGGYVPVNLEDYGQGGEDTEQRFGEAEEKEYKKGEERQIEVEGKDGIIRKCDMLITYADDRIVKAKVYINSPSEAPKGRTVKRGGRGGYYYITSERQKPHEKTKPVGRAISMKPKKHKGWGKPKKKKEKKVGEWEEPEPPDVTEADRYLIIEGDDVGIYIMEFDGRLESEALDNPPTREMIELLKPCFTSNDEDKFKCAARVAKENGLTVKTG